jgi:two-component system KDP operon response regulator KdpE
MHLVFITSSGDREVMNKTSVLVVDDEKALRDFVRRNLEIRGFQVLSAANGLEALALFQNNVVDLVVLDLMMPHMDGLEMVRRVRERSLVPVIILSALGEEEDKVRALNMGADDYLTKPFGVDELLSRIHAVLRRTRWTQREASGNGLTISGEIVLDRERREVTRAGMPVDLTPTEFELLAYLMENAGKALPHKAILQYVWGPEYGHETEYLRVYIGRLRQKIEADPADPHYLLTIRSIGYSFNG